MFNHKPLAWCIKAALLASVATSANSFAFEEEKKVKLEVIEVTAQRRTQNLQEVPISVAAIQGEALDAYGSSGMDIRFLSARIPSLSIESSFGRTFPRFYVRGLGNTDFDLNASQPVSLVFDDIVMENPILKGFPVFDLEGIEVLRGPQGTLFGRNTPAGLVKFASAKPTQDLDGYFSASYGTKNSLDLQGAVGFGLTDELSTRVSLLRQTKDDWIDNKAVGYEQDKVLGGYQEIAGRVQFLYETDNFNALLNYHWRDLNGKPIAFRGDSIKLGSNDLVDGFDRDVVKHDAAAFATQNVENEGASLKLEFLTENHTITSVTGYESVEFFSRADVDGERGAGLDFLVGTPLYNPALPFAAESADAIPEHSQISQEIRVASNELGVFDYQFGAFYFKEKVTIESFSYDSLAGVNAPNTVAHTCQTQTLNELTSNGYACQEQETTAWAVFGSADYDVSDTVKLTAGIRYSKDEKDFIAERKQSNLGFLAFVDDQLGPITRETSDSQISWDVSLSKVINDDVNVYGRVAKGFRAPSIQGRVLFGDEVTVADSETIHSIEAGIKSSVWDDRARVNVSTFYFEMDDQQLTAVGGDSNSNRLLNADKTVGYGFEVDAEVAITEDLLATFGVSYNNTEIQDAGLAVAACGSCTVTDPLNGDGLAIIDGNSLPHAPEWIANFTLRYSQEFGEGELFAYTDWAYRSKINFFLYDSTEFTGDAMLEGGVRVGYLWDSESYSHEVAVFGRNITNTERLIGGVDFNNRTAIVNDPAFWGVEYKVSFF